MERFELVNIIKFSVNQQSTDGYPFSMCGAAWFLDLDTEKYVKLTCGKIKENFFVEMITERKKLIGLQKTIRISQKEIQKHLFQQSLESHVFFYQNLNYFNIKIRFYKSVKNEINLTPQMGYLEINTSSASSTEDNEQRPEDKRINLHPENSHLSEFSNDLSSLFEKELLSDVTLKCGNEVFKAHKAILSSRSPIFAAMFRTPMKESQEDTVTIKDIKSEVFLILLQYVYSGKMQKLNDWSTACAVLSAADMYQIPTLKRACTGYLCSAMSENNALTILQYAELYDVDLEQRAIRYVCDKFIALKKTTEWDTLQKEKPYLALKVLSEKI